MTHTNHALHLNVHAGNWIFDQDGTLTIKGLDDRYRGVTFHQPYNTLDWEHKQDSRDLNRAICLMADPDGYVGCYRLVGDGDTLYALCYDTDSPSGVRTVKILNEGVKCGQGWNVITVIIPNRTDRESISLKGDVSYAPFPGSTLPALCEIEWEGLDDGVDVSEWRPSSEDSPSGVSAVKILNEGVFDSGKVTYTMALDALRSALNITAAHALSIVDTACENEPSGLGEYYTVTGHRFIQIRPHEWIPVPCPAGSTTWDWADVKLELDGFPLIASTNPLADLPSDKIKALEAGLEALRTLRLSGVDWQRLAAEE